MPAEPRPCDTHADLFNFEHELPNLTESLKARRKIKIVAIGSSSTAGEGDIAPYPSRLETLLRERFYHDIDVLNRGISGQEAPSELARFEPDVLAEAPALVIWQVGTNAVFRKEEFNFEDVVADIVTGLRRLRDLPIDVVMMDSQYTPAVVEPKATLDLSEKMVARISRAAEDSGANVFRRFGLMQHWVDHDHIPISELVREGDPNRLHMSDWATDCVTAALFQSISARAEAAGVT
jgi:acyl-CoA thioesterase-1